MQGAIHFIHGWKSSVDILHTEKIEPVCFLPKYIKIIESIKDCRNIFVWHIKLKPGVIADKL